MTQETPQHIRDSIRFHLDAWASDVCEIYKNSAKERGFSEWLRQVITEADNFGQMAECNARIGRCIEELSRRVRNEKFVTGESIKRGHLKELYEHQLKLDNERLLEQSEPQLIEGGQCDLCNGRGCVDVLWYWNMELCRNQLVPSAWKPWPCDRIFQQVQPCSCPVGNGINKTDHFQHSLERRRYITTHYAFRRPRNGPFTQLTAYEFIQACVQERMRKYGKMSAPDRQQRTKMRESLKKVLKDSRSGMKALVDAEKDFERT